MYTYAPLSPDLNLVAAGVVIWVVAISVAFTFYLPFLRAGRSRVPVRGAQVKYPVVEIDDFRHAALP
ncbi:MAG TPA: hypothetical protein VFW13_13800, partial [Phenylobacterium sp.]|nr:hypothetical protein [Phenylobacterium sp.]